MRSVILTRPLSSSDGIQQQLEQSGLTVYPLPTLTLTVLENTDNEALVVKNWTSYTIVMFVSQHAAQFAYQHMTRLNLSWSPNTWLASVGQGTLQMLRQLWPEHTRFIAPMAGDSQDTEGLWQAISEQNELKTPQKLLIVRAEHGRDTLQQLAQQAGWQTDIFACNQRKPRQLSNEEMDQLKQAVSEQTILVITSIEGLNALTQQLSSQQLKNLQSQLLVTIHPRIAQFAEGCGFEHVRCCSPSELTTNLIQYANA